MSRIQAPKIMSFTIIVCIHSCSNKFTYLYHNFLSVLKATEYMWFGLHIQLSGSLSLSSKLFLDVVDSLQAICLHMLCAYLRIIPKWLPCQQLKSPGVWLCNSVVIQSRSINCDFHMQVNILLLITIMIFNITFSLYMKLP